MPTGCSSGLVGITTSRKKGVRQRPGVGRVRMGVKGEEGLAPGRALRRRTSSRMNRISRSFVVGYLV